MGYELCIQETSALVASCTSRSATFKVLAELEIRKRRRLAIETRIRGLKDDLENEVSRHQSACAPIQEKLLAVDAEMVSGLVDGTDVTKQDKRRAELTDQLEAANTGLEEASKRINAQLKVLEDELQSPALAVSAWQACKNRLLQLADEDTQSRLEVLRDRARWIQQRLDFHLRRRDEFSIGQEQEACRLLGLAFSSANTREHGRTIAKTQTTYSGPLRRVEAVIVDAQKQSAECKAAMDEILAEVFGDK